MGPSVVETPTQTQFWIVEKIDDDAALRLTLQGELDLAVVHILERRLDHLRSERRRARLDLSMLGFIDATGLGALVRGVHESRHIDRMLLVVAPCFSDSVRRLFELVGVTATLLDEGGCPE